MKLLICLFLAISFNASAEIQRDAKQKYAFRSTHPCPATGKYKGACPGFVVDHIWPLCAGGADNPSNMQYQEYGESLVKDKWERQLCRSMKK